MIIEHRDYILGEQVLFYIRKEEVNIPSSVTVRCYTSCEGIKNYTLKLLEEGIYTFSVMFKFTGKYILVFSEDNIKKSIMVATVK